MKNIINTINNIDEVDLRNYIQEAALNEGYRHSSKIRLLDGEVKSVQFIKDKHSDTRIILKLIDVVLRSPDVGVEELGDVSLIKYENDNKGWQYAF